MLNRLIGCILLLATGCAHTRTESRGDRVILLRNATSMTEGMACASPPQIPAAAKSGVLSSHAMETVLFHACEAQLNRRDKDAKAYREQAEAIIRAAGLVELVERNCPSPADAGSTPTSGEQNAIQVPLQGCKLKKATRASDDPTVTRVTWQCQDKTSSTSEQLESISIALQHCQLREVTPAEGNAKETRFIMQCRDKQPMHSSAIVKKREKACKMLLNELHHALELVR